MSQYPYDQQPAYPPYYPQPADSAGGVGRPAEYAQPAYAQPQYAQPVYPQPVYAAPQPVQVNVNQYAGGPVVVRKKVNHFMHFCLTLLTGGLWLVVWIPAAMRGGRTRVYR